MSVLNIHGNGTNHMPSEPDLNVIVNADAFLTNAFGDVYGCNIGECSPTGIRVSNFDEETYDFFIKGLGRRFLFDRLDYIADGIISPCTVETIRDHGTVYSIIFDARFSNCFIYRKYVTTENTIQIYESDDLGEWYQHVTYPIEDALTPNTDQRIEKFFIYSEWIHAFRLHRMLLKWEQGKKYGWNWYDTYAVDYQNNGINLNVITEAEQFLKLKTRIVGHMLTSPVLNNTGISVIGDSGHTENLKHQHTLTNLLNRDSTFPASNILPFSQVDILNDKIDRTKQIKVLKYNKQTRKCACEYGHITSIEKVEGKILVGIGSTDPSLIFTNTTIDYGNDPYFLFYADDDGLLGFNCLLDMEEYFLRYRTPRTSYADDQNLFNEYLRITKTTQKNK